MSETLLERNRTLLERITRPAAIAEPLEDLFRRGKHAQLLEGRDARGVPFAPLAPATLRRPRESTTPLLPHGAASRPISAYVVTVSAEPGRLRVEAAWPGFPQIRFLASGTRRMPARDPGGFRPEDVAAAMRLLKDWVMRHGR